MATSMATSMIAMGADSTKLRNEKEYQNEIKKSQVEAAQEQSRNRGFDQPRVRLTADERDNILNVKRKIIMPMPKRKTKPTHRSNKTKPTPSNETKHTPTPAFGTQKSHASRIATFKRRKPPLELVRRLVLEPAEPHGIVKSPDSNRGNNHLIPPYKMPGGKKKRKSRRKSKKRHSRKHKKRSLKHKRRSRKHKRHSRKHKRHSRKHKR